LYDATRRNTTVESRIETSVQNAFFSQECKSFSQSLTVSIGCQNLTWNLW